MTIEQFYDAYRTRVPFQYLSCLDALVELLTGPLWPDYPAGMTEKIADKTHHSRQHVSAFFKFMRELRKNGGNS